MKDIQKTDPQAQLGIGLPAGQPISQHAEIQALERIDNIARLVMSILEKITEMNPKVMKMLAEKVKLKETLGVGKLPQTTSKEISNVGEAEKIFEVVTTTIEDVQKDIGDVKLSEVRTLMAQKKHLLIPLIEAKIKVR